MGKIGNAIQEIHTIEETAKRDQWVNRLHPLVKLFLTIFDIALVVSFSKYQLTGVLGMVLYPLLMFELAEVGWRDALRRLRIVLPLVCVVGVFNPLFDRHTIAYLGTVPVSGGVVSMLTLMLKGILTVLAAYLLIATTSVEKICDALRRMHMPKFFVTQILLIYRYLTVLLTEAERMMQAYALRAPGQRGIHYRTWGPMIGRLLLRSMDRARELYESMCLRGYDGEFCYGSMQTMKGRDWAFLLIWTAALLFFRVYPVPDLVGGLFVGAWIL